MQVQNGESEGGKLFELDESKKLMSKANEFLPPSGPFASFQSWKEESNHILTIDIGCGSGIIGTSLGDTSTEILFLDISEEALEVAKKNFKANFPTKRAWFIVSDLLSYFLTPIENSELSTTDHLLLLANLPYIKENDWENMSADTHYEPKLALFGGEKTGFEMYERLFWEIEILNKLLPHTKITLLCEFGFDQRKIAESILQGYPNWQYTFFADYAGIERFVEVYIEG